LRAIQETALSDPWAGLLAPAVAGPPTVLVATPDAAARTPVGYAVAIPGDDVVQVAELAVSAPHRRAGHGSALVDALDERFRDRGFRALRLVVRADDATARSFYDALGFTIRERLPDEFATSDGLVLERPLDGE
jgi:ribosomal protein S18 acetylase RimI-like enzyme